MSLPGKLCVGILEEDNPLRSYFRFKPLLMEENGRYIPFEDAGRYPDEGCIRIVPDKNESYYFKSRMRQNGLFSVVDLRDHPNENDKIRPNKNYRHGGEEINAFIIYSDVVRQPAADMILQLLPAEALEAPVARPHTSRVLIRKADGIDPICHEWKLTDEENSLGRLTATETRCDLGDFQVFDIPGFRGNALSFAIKPAALMVSVCEPISAPPKSEPVHPADRHGAESAAPAVVVKPRVEERAPAERPAPPPPRPAAPEPQPVTPPAEKPVPPEHPPVVQKAEDVPAEKPWIHRDAQMLPPPIDRRLSRAEQLMAAQAGLNPRRGRSLQELIDEKWQHSRLNQLGMPVSPISTGAPVKNPVDAAVEAVRAVWVDPLMQQELLNALAHLDRFTDQLSKRRELAMESAVAEQLNALEAQRLELLADLERVKEGGRQIREQLKQEIRRDEADALSEAVEKTRVAQEAQQRYEKLAEDARLAAADAQNTLDSLVGDKLEEKIRDVALARRIEERLELLRGNGGSIPPTAEKLGINAFIDRLMKQFSAAGWSWTREEATNLCVSLALSPVLLLSGGPGSGKTTCARMLSNALGLQETGRAVLCPPGVAPLRKDAQVRQLQRTPETPAMVILDDANLSPTQDILRGMAQCPNPEWRVVVTLQDAHSGTPLNANALDQGFMVRLSAPEGAPWQPPMRELLSPEELVSIESIRTSMPRAEVPQALVDRMDALRSDMSAYGAAISRRALDDAWRYCSTMVSLLGKGADLDALFDRVVAQRILPATLASAPIEAVKRLREITRDLPLCSAWLKQPLPVSL